MRRLLVLVAAAAAMVLGAAACNPVTPYAALVNGQAVSSQDLNMELEAIRDSPQYLASLEANQISVTGEGKGTFNADFVAQVLRRQVFWALVHQAVVDRHLVITAEDLQAAADDVRQQLGYPGEFESLPKDYRQFLAQHQAEVTALQASLARVDVSPAAIAAYYAAHRQQFVEACVQHILVASQAQAAQIKAALAAGAPFDQEARANSTDQGSIQAGGRLGCGPTTQYVAPFAQAVQTLPLNQVSDPVQTQFGWHLIEVTARQQQPLSQAAPQIRAQLLQQSQSALNAFIDRRVARSNIAVDSRYGRWVTAGPGGQSGVVPPRAPTPRSDTPTTAATAPSPLGTPGP